MVCLVGWAYLMGWVYRAGVACSVGLGNSATGTTARAGPAFKAEIAAVVGLCLQLWVIPFLKKKSFLSS